MNRNITRSLTKRSFAQKATPNNSNNLINNDASNREGLKRALNAKISPEAQNEEVMKRWMKKFLNKGHQNDLEDVEEVFDESLKDNDGWITDKVWTGKQIPTEFLEDNVNLDKMLNSDWDGGEYEYEDEDITESVIKHSYPIPDEKPISDQGDDNAQDQESVAQVEGVIKDDSTIEAIIKDNREVHNIFQNLKKEENLDDQSMELIKNMLENDKGEFLNMWNTFEKDQAKEISTPKTSPPVTPKIEDEHQPSQSNSSLLEAIRHPTPDLLIKLCKNPDSVYYPASHISLQFYIKTHNLLYIFSTLFYKTT